MGACASAPITREKSKPDLYEASLSKTRCSAWHLTFPSQPTPADRNPLSLPSTKIPERPGSTEHAGLVIVGSPASVQDSPRSALVRLDLGGRASQSFSHNNQRVHTDAALPPVQAKRPKNWRPKTAQPESSGHKARWRQRVQQSDMAQEIVRKQIDKEKNLGVDPNLDPAVLHSMLKESSRGATPLALGKEERRKEAAQLVEVMGGMAGADNAIVEKRLREALKKL